MSDKSLFSDNEYKIMTEIVENETITQRELSKTLGVSVSTVNVLMNKMIKEGLIKMTHVSQKQVLYMLTPVGMMEKAKKTVSYLKYHYRAMYETKEKIKEIITKVSINHDAIFVMKSYDEMGEMMDIAINEMNVTKLNIITFNEYRDIDANAFNSPALVYLCADDYQLNKTLGVRDIEIINLVNEL